MERESPIGSSPRFQSLFLPSHIPKRDSYPPLLPHTIYFPMPTDSCTQLGGITELAAAAAAEDPCKRWRDCIDALEGERRKIEVFRRELPLCLELITQTIESCRQQMENSGRAPVLEKFMPMCGAYDGEVVEEGWEDAGRSVDEADGAVEESDDRGSEGKADWLGSVQLWSSHGRGQDQKLEAMRPIALDIGKGTGAFRPFSRENCCLAKQPSSAVVLAPSHQAAEEEEQQQQEHVAAGAESSTTETGGGEGCGSSSGKKASSEDQEKGQSRRKMRRCWSAELHRRFLNALGELGGAHIATPKQIREAMKVEGLTSDEIKSHLQKYRLHSRRPSIPAPSNPGSHQAPHFFLVGGIWVPPPEHAIAAAAAPSVRDGNNPPPNVVYTPVALAPAQPNYNQKDLGQTFTTVPLQQARCAAAAGDRGSPSSPATSSCSRSTSTCISRAPAT